jgi:hypothetical protein
MTSPSPVPGASASKPTVSPNAAAPEADSRSWEQQDLAGTLGISQSRVSQIERQGVDDTVVSTLATYVEALGASVLIVADFGEEQFVLRRTPNPSISGETGMSRPDL